MGYPAPNFMAVSMSSGVASPRSTILMASSMLGTNSRLTMKPETQGHAHCVLHFNVEFKIEKVDFV
jgi:hypothetical protein